MKELREGLETLALLITILIAGLLFGIFILLERLVVWGREKV